MNVTDKRPSLSIVVLAYKAGESIIEFLAVLKNDLQTAGIDDFQIVLVANYHATDPSDKTANIAHNLARADPRIKVIAEVKMGMMGWDARMGLVAADGESIALIDGDGQMPPEDIVRGYKVMANGEVDFVKTYRASREDGIYRLISSKAFNLLFRILFPRSRFRDINSKPKLLTRSALEKMNLSCDGWFLDGEIIIEALRLQLRYIEIPTVFQENEWRGSFVKFSTIFEMIFSLIKYRFKKLKSL